MSKVIALSSLLIITFVLMSACGGTDPNANLANTVGIGNVNTSNGSLPPGFSTSPLPLNGTPTPGIPEANKANVVVPGATPTPGIDPKNVNMKPRAGATPTPGIPSEEELRRQMRGSSTSTVSGDGPNMMKSTNATPIMRMSNTNGPRTVRKP